MTLLSALYHWYTSEKNKRGTLSNKFMCQYQNKTTHRIEKRRKKKEEYKMTKHSFGSFLEKKRLHEGKIEAFLS